MWQITWGDRKTREKTIGWGSYKTKEKAQAEVNDLKERWEKIRKGSTTNITIWVGKGEGK